MTPRRHAKLAHDLIEACGGLAEAASACRVSKSVLSTYQNPNEASTMPADVMADLEAYCGEPIYSREIMALRPWAAQPSGCVVDETHDVVIKAAALGPLAMAVRAGEPGAIDRFTTAMDDLAREYRECLAAAKVVSIKGAA